jgi:hypothetical protein
MSTTPQDILKRQLDFTNVSKYHEQGFTGKGLVVFNSESHIGENNKHGRMTNMVLHQFAPDVTIINGTTGSRTSGNKVIEYYVVTTDGVKYDFEEFIIKFNVKLMTTSLVSAQANKAIQDYLKGVQESTGLIMFCAAGNEGSAGADGKYVKNDTAIAVGAGVIRENGTVNIAHYSAIDDEVDFIAPMGTGSGTSAASPALTGMTALLLQKYGDFNQKECVEILKSIAVDLGQPGKDPKFGWGMPILPLGDELKIIIGGAPMTFTDVEDTRWSKSAIDFCVEKGLLVGFEDGTFRPAEPVTREQIAVILERLIKL